MKAAFTLRDLFWLVLVCAMGCAWWLHYKRTDKVARGLDQEVSAAKSEVAGMTHVLSNLVKERQDWREAVYAHGLYVDRRRKPPILVENSGRPFERSYKIEAPRYDSTVDASKQRANQNNSNR